MALVVGLVGSEDGEEEGMVLVVVEEEGLVADIGSCYCEPEWVVD
jgi:hypothetical protein